MIEIPIAKYTLPFMLAAGVNAVPQINKPRIVEAVVIGAILALCGKVFALPVLTEQIETVNKNIARVEVRVASVEDKLETRRAVRDDQMDGVKKAITAIQIEQARTRVGR